MNGFDTCPRRELAFGLDTLDDVPEDDAGTTLTYPAAIRQVVEEAGGAPDPFAPYVDLCRRATERLGTVARPVGMHVPGFIADTDAAASLS